MVRYQALKGFYEVEKTIGCGGFAKVKLATHLATGEKVAIKIMHKEMLGTDLPRVKLELKALQSLSHENICKLYEVIETDSHFFIVMEYCSGGELFDHIIEKNRLTESESRMFFRQIVSAVAYLHSLGYAHRDLKPENVLLDKNQNLKLIDFGLCAKPEGGIQSPLLTSCGSPTYAAPELVLGKEYLGAEVDVWAMGVLLYALLAGSLPFDDLNIDTLYKKIVAGKYEQPSFMSRESLALIKAMLQADPKKRITVDKLLDHPWLTLGILDPIEVKSEHTKIYDSNCIKIMANHYQVDPDVMWHQLKNWKYDYHTSTYFLLLAKRKRGSMLRLNNLGIKLPLNLQNAIPNKNCLQLESVPVNTKVIFPNNNKSTPNQSTSHNMATESTPKTPIQYFSPHSNFVEPRQRSSIRKPMKRIRSPGPDDSSPIPTKKITTEHSTPTHTPNRKKLESYDTPGSARKVLGSIEKSFHKVVNVFTPRKTEEQQMQQPTLLKCKNLCNVSTTQCRNPELVISQLSKALEKKGIHCKRKGFRLRGKLEPNSKLPYGECSFELEICYLPVFGSTQIDCNSSTPTKYIFKKGPLSFATPIFNTMKQVDDANVENDEYSCSISPFVGIRRKRLRGDAWFYKKVCEEVLALAANDLWNVIESSV